ncbi:hypothetical protein K449DRAFT_435059 [Hypoxylon sp. EC38]|nr:hypothetical protein K449DRAFT_435059 [Hypoxylon sp. EC38]
MDRLPLELVEHIIHEVVDINTESMPCDDDLIQTAKNTYEVTKLAGVSRLFQVIVERLTFSVLYLRENRIPKAISILDRLPHRIRSLRALRIKIEPERIDQITLLFDFLSWLRLRPHIAKKIYLSLEVDVPSAANYKDLLSHKAWLRSSRIPQFPFDVYLQFQHLTFGPPPNIGTILGMISNFTHLNYLNLEVDDACCSRRRIRDIQSKTIETLNNVPPVKFFIFDTHGFRHKNHFMTLMPGDSEDRMASALRQLSQRLEEGKFRGVLGSPQLFWPKQLAPEQPGPYWPDLDCIDILYEPQMPSGERLFLIDGQWHPNQTRLDEFYRAVAFAITRMPKLRTMNLKALLWWELLTPYYFHIFSFVVRGKVATATWRALPRYVPCEEIIQILKQAAHHRDLELVVEIDSSEWKM